MCQHHRQHDRARRQRAEAAPRAEGLTNAPQGESTTETPSTHPHNNVRLVRTAGDVPLPAFRQHTDAQAAHGCGRADRRRVSGGTQGRRGGESAPRPHHRGVYTQVFACSAARSVCAMYLAAGQASDCGGCGGGSGAVAGGTPGSPPRSGLHDTSSIHFKQSSNILKTYDNTYGRCRAGRREDA
jgi:hypothetical protein